MCWLRVLATCVGYVCCVGRRRDMRRHPSQEEEPEWFTGGPSSQSDTIELISFEMAEAQKAREAEDKKDTPDNRNGRLTVLSV